MKNSIIKDKIKKLSDDTQEILERLLSDAILEINFRHRVSEDILERIVLIYLSLFDEKSYLEYEELNLSEKNIICRIISKGIASIYVDDEYLNSLNSCNKLVIINEMIELLCFLTDLNRSTIKRFVIRDIKVYFCKGWRWDFL